MNGALTVIGSLNVDQVLRVERLPLRGETLQASGHHIAFGGKGANQAFAAARLGARTSMIGCVGGDQYGEAILASLAEAGVDTSAITRVAGQSTGLAFLHIEPSGDNRITLWPGANDHLDPDRVDAHRRLVADARLLLMQLETPREALIQAAILAKERGGRVILNPAPAKPLPPELASRVDILTPNESEAATLSGLQVRTPEEASKAAVELQALYGIHTIVITLGAQGVWLQRGHQGRHLSGFAVDAVDTTAAGDSLHGGLVAGLLEGLTLTQAIRLGQGAAALCVTRPGAQGAIPHRSEVEAFLRHRD